MSNLNLNDFSRKFSLTVDGQSLARDICDGIAMAIYGPPGTVKTIDGKQFWFHVKNLNVLREFT